MEPFKVMHVMNPGNDPEFGSKNYLSRDHDLCPAISDSNEDGVIYLEIQKLRLKEDEEGGKDSGEGEEENVDKKTEESGGDGDSQKGWDCADENENLGGWAGDGGWGEVEKKDETSESSYHYPLRPDAEDCVFYLKTGSCKFGSNCKFNHPVRRNFQDMEDLVSQPRSTECKMGGSKFGRACRYDRTRPKGSDNSVVELNFVGLPVRSDEKECPYYMRTGSCKYGAYCKFNHPDPSASVRSNRLGPGTDGSQSPHGSSESANTSWSSSRTVTETVPFVPVVPLYLSERRMLQPTGYVVNNPARKTHLCRHKRMQMETFPQRPGQPECNYFVRTGDCKFKYTCKYHHPKNLNVKSTRCILNDEGLPLRSDQSVCAYYSHYGICKFGPACKFDHPIGFTSLTGRGY